MKDMERLKNTTLAAMDYVAGQMLRKETESGKYGVWMGLPGTENLALLMAEPSARRAAEMTLTVRVLRRGTDLCMMHFIKTAPEAELLAYLQDAGNAQELLDSLTQLSDGIDDRY